MQTLIYLIENADGQPLYVGKTVNLARRRREHWKRFGHSIKMQVLETVTGEWQARERYWIAKFKSEGIHLLNRALGGVGGRVHAESTRALISRQQRGRKKPDGFGEHLSASQKGKPRPWTPSGALRVAATQFKPGVNSLSGMSPEALSKRNEKLSAAVSSLPYEERSRRNKKAWAEATAEERAARGRNISKGQSRAGIVRRTDHLGEASRKFWASLTPDAKAEQIARREASRQATLRRKKGEA